MPKSTHKPNGGEECDICTLSDYHLLNIIRCHGNNARAAALGDKPLSNQYYYVDRIRDYVVEAVVRGLDVRNEVCSVFERTHAVAPADLSAKVLFSSKHYQALMLNDELDNFEDEWDFLSPWDLFD
jgi:hypothetical protein